MCSRQNPSVFGGASPYLREGQWQIVVTYRRAVSDLHHQGRKPYPELDPFGPVNKQNQLNFDATYAISRRLSFSLNVPVSVNSFAIRRIPPGGQDYQWAETRARGLGDISARANLWLFRPREGGDWNIGLSLGVKAPAGKAGVTDTIFGRTIPVDISVQPGDKAWAPILSAQTFKQFPWVTAFGSATYVFNARNTTGVRQFFGLLGNPNSRTLNSSTDQFVSQWGAAVRTKERWPVPIVAYRVSGVPVSDVFGPFDGFRRPGTIGAFEPGLSYPFGGNVVTVTVPITTYVNIKDSPKSPRIEDATVPKYSFTLTWVRRF